MEKSYSEKVADGLNRFVDIGIVILIVLALLYSGYALWDSWRVVHSAHATQNNLMVYKPGNNLGASFEELLALNPDVVAWITVDDTNIDYPVVQGRDNDEYLHTNVFGEYDPVGAIFLVTSNAPDFSDSYNILMGHHMQADAMFGNLDLFLDEAFFFDHTSARLFLPDKTLELESVALVQPDAYDAMIYTAPSHDMHALSDYVIDHATYYRPGVLKDGDTLIALSTCASYITNGRTVMIYRVINEKSTL